MNPFLMMFLSSIIFLVWANFVGRFYVAALFLSENDVRKLSNMSTAIEVMETCFRSLAAGTAQNIPRTRFRMPGIMMHTLMCSDESLGALGWKIYTTTKDVAQFLVGVYDSQSGSMTGLIEADVLGQIRTGAASGLATKYLARTDANSIGIIGTGTQAATQLEAMLCVRKIERVSVFSRNIERCTQFASKMAEQFQIDVVPETSIEETIKEKSIVITATTARSPLFDGDFISEGTHINAVGSNYLKKAEVDHKLIQRVDCLVCDNIEQCQLEAGDLVGPISKGFLDWDHVVELADIASPNGSELGRTDDSQITLFKSVGLGIQDLFLATELLREAKKQNVGEELPF